MPTIVLAVDDEALILELAVALFEELGCLVLSADSAEAAMRIIDSDEHSIALLFTDVQMPGMDGCELASRARDRRPGLRVVLTSGRSCPKGEAHFVAKPYCKQDLALLLS